MDFKKVTDALNAAVKGTKEPDTLKALAEAQRELEAAQKEAEKIENERKELDDANHKLTEALKGQILATGGTKTPPQEQEGERKSFDQLLAEAAKKYAETQKGK